MPYLMHCYAKKTVYFTYFTEYYRLLYIYRIWQTFSQSFYFIKKYS